MEQIFFRHGIALDRTCPSCPSDAQRPLTDKGVRRCKQAARGLRRLAPQVRRILTSPYVRAVESAEIVADAYDLDRDGIVEIDALLPGTDPRALMDIVDGQRREPTIYVGHRPNLDEVLAYALTEKERPISWLKKAGAACIACDTSGDWELKWLMPPKALRQLGDDPEPVGARVVRG